MSIMPQGINNNNNSHDNSLASRRLAERFIFIKLAYNIFAQNTIISYKLFSSSKDRYK